jgi:hypothetical protein
MVLKRTLLKSDERLLTRLYGSVKQALPLRQPGRLVRPYFASPPSISAGNVFVCAVPGR